MNRLAGVVVLTAFAGLQSSPGIAAPAGLNYGDLRVAFAGIAGRVMEAGEEVKIGWEMAGRSVPILEGNPWAECELLFSSDDGRSWTRVTPRLSVSLRDYSWVVPDVPTTAARIGLQIGIEGDGEIRQFASGRFEIRSSRRVGSVSLSLPVQRELRGGSTLDIEWTSTVADLRHFEVLVSSDRGAHFFSLGETTQNRFSYAIPDDYEGSLTFQVVAHRHTSPPLRSGLDERAIFVVRAADAR